MQPESSRPGSVHPQDRFKVYRNHLTRQWQVLRGFSYYGVGLSFEEALSMAVSLADKDRAGARTLARLANDRRSRVR